MFQAKNYYRVLIFSSFYFFLQLGCNSGKIKSIKTLVELGNSVIELVNNFTGKSSSFSDRVEKIYSFVNEGINDGNTDLPKIAKFYEYQWGIVHKEFDQLYVDVEKLKIQAAMYFNTLDDETNMIKDSITREYELKINESYKDKWEKAYSNALLSLDDTKKVIVAGDDFKQVLRAHVMREKINEDIDMLKEVSDKSKKLSNDVKAFEESARIIFGIKKQTN